MKELPKLNENCFITGRKCNRYFECSERCFVACPSRDKVGLELGIIESKCKDYNIEPYIAVNNRVLGKDVFCEKICSQIIEARFCIVLLKHDRKQGIIVPNANVYYEYGLMVGLQKKIIPVQEKGAPTFFNVRGIDTITYTPQDFEEQIEAAIKIFGSESSQIEQTRGTVRHSYDSKFALHSLRKHPRRSQRIRNL